MLFGRAQRKRAATDERQAWKQMVLRERRTRHPTLLRAVRADARVALLGREGLSGRWSRSQTVVEVVGLVWRDNAFLALALYRLKARCQALGIPFLPRLAHRLAMLLGQVCIGDPVVMAPGIATPYGNVVIDGLVEIGPGTLIGPSVTIGLQAGDPRGPTIGAGVTIGDGAKVIGPVTIGDDSVIAPNSVVVSDVGPRRAVIGIPAR